MRDKSISVTSGREGVGEECGEGKIKRREEKEEQITVYGALTMLI